MRSFLALAIASAVSVAAVNRASAVELLVAGGFEIAGGSVPSWTLQESLVGGDPFDTAEVVGFTPIEGERDLWLKAFGGGGPLTFELGNYDEDNLPMGDVDGDDFLEWQQGNSPTPGSDEDFATWKALFGNRTGLQTNAAITQTRPATPGETYIFKGQSRWEPNYSGGYETLGEFGPLGAVASPTTTTVELAFLNAGGAVVGAPVVLNLKADGQMSDDTWRPWGPAGAGIQGVAPAGATQVRVTARANNMIWNDLDDTSGEAQSAFYDDFSLTTASSVTELLGNRGLEDLPDSSLEAWTVDQVDDDPLGPNGIVQPAEPPLEVVRTVGFAARTGAEGVWLSPFHGSTEFPVDGILSQTFSAAPGNRFTFSGWSKWEANYSGGKDMIDDDTTDPNNPLEPSPTETEIRLEFLNSVGDVIDFEMIDVRADRAAELGGNPNADTWVQHTIANAIAPAGTTQVRASASMLDGVYSATGAEGPAQSAFWDDFSLDFSASLAAVPEPTSLAAGLVGAALALVRRGGRRGR